MWFRRVVQLLLMHSVVLFGTALHWQGDYNKALHQAQMQKKPLLVLLVKKSEPLCNTIIKNVFMHQPYIEKLNQNSIAVMVTYEGYLSYPIELYYSTHFPTLFFVNSEKETFMSDPLYGEDINFSSVQEQMSRLDLSQQKKPLI